MWQSSPTPAVLCSTAVLGAREHHVTITCHMTRVQSFFSSLMVETKGRATEHLLNSTLPIRLWEWARESQVAVITFCHNQPVSTSCSGQHGLSIHVFLFFPVGSTLLRFLSHPRFISSLISSIPSLFRSLPVYSCVILWQLVVFSWKLLRLTY